MTQYSKFNVIYRLQKWMDSVPGQTFLNYAYSWGASIVILGTLFKLTHLPGANFFLFLGMGTEVFVFFLSAFDRPFDKTADGMELPTHVGGVIKTPEEAEIPENAEQLQPAAIIGGGAPVVEGGTPVVGGGTIIIGGGGGAGTGAAGSHVAASADGNEEVSPVRVNTEAVAAVSSSVATMAGSTAGQQTLPKMDPELEQATTDYVAELKRLTEMLSKVAEQSEKLGRNSEEMDNLDRTLTGICKVYEMQLKSASSQIGTIDEINEQTKKMAKQIEELNRIYTRMIEAMTVNMPAGAVRPQV